MDLGLGGKRALITGGSRGIGRATAEVLADEGVHPLLVARDAAVLAEAKEAVRARRQVNVTTIAADLSREAEVLRVANAAGDIDILVNNAGAIPGGDLAAVDEARWRTAWDLKVFGYVNMTRRFYAVMRGRRAGVIVNVIGSAGNASLMAFTRAIGGTAPRDGLRVVGINPGPVMTDRLLTLMRTRAQARFGDAERWRELMTGYAFGRAAKPEEIAWMAAFLASDKSGYTSGSIVTIDGGAGSRRSAL